MLHLLVVFLAIQSTVLCNSVFRRYVPHFDNGRAVTHITSSSINEASGICASRVHKNVIYTHNDSGDTHRIFAFSAENGNRLGTITIDGAHSRDWEDIACGPCAGGSGHCIYIADTGGNAGGDENTIYRIREPSHLGDQHVSLDSTLKFSWDQHDCETVMVDNHGEVYVVSKVSAGHHPKFVHLPSYAWGTGRRDYVSNGVYMTITSRSYNPVGGDISPSGHEVLIKAYGHVYYWYVPNGDYSEQLKKPPVEIPHHWEQQGESVCFEPNGSGYYTLSEGHNQPLYYFHRQGQAPITG